MNDAATETRFVVLVRDKHKRTHALLDDETRVLFWDTRCEAESVAREHGGEVMEMERDGS